MAAIARIASTSSRGLVPSHATKNGKRYRYYVTSEGPGRSAPSSPKLRVPAATVDGLVVAGLQSFLRDRAKISAFLRESKHRAAQLGRGLEIAGHLAHSLASGAQAQPSISVADLVARVTVGAASLKVSINRGQLRTTLSSAAAEPPEQAQTSDVISFDVPFVASDRAEITKLLIEKPGQVQRDNVAVKAVARAWVWFEQLTEGKAQSMAGIAARENITDNYVSNLIHLAWLSPAVVNRTLEGDYAAADLAKEAMLSRAVGRLWKEQALSR